MEQTDANGLVDFLKAKKVKEAAKKANEERFAANSKRKLETNLRKKFQTTMVGALAKFEERFGDLWGHGILTTELNEEQARYREIWDVVRTEILNNGNNQLRSAVEELARYNVIWTGYHVELPIKSIVQPNEVFLPAKTKNVEKDSEEIENE